MTERLPAALEATAICRRVEAAGGFATVIRRGDGERGTLLLLVTERGTERGLLERTMSGDWTYRWQFMESSAARPVDLAARLGGDPDAWGIELDIADAQRFVAEMTALG